MSLNTSKLHTSVGRAIKPLNIAGAAARMHSRDYIEIINVIYKDNPNGNCCSKTHKLPKVDDKPILRKRWHVRKYDEGEDEISPSSAGRVDGERRLGTGYRRQGSGLARGSTANSAYRRKVLDVNDQVLFYLYIIYVIFCLPYFSKDLKNYFIDNIIYIYTN